MTHVIEFRTLDEMLKTIGANPLWITSTRIRTQAGIIAQYTYGVVVANIELDTVSVFTGLIGELNTAGMSTWEANEMGKSFAERCKTAERMVVDYLIEWFDKSGRVRPNEIFFGEVTSAKTRPVWGELPSYIMDRVGYVTT